MPYSSPAKLSSPYSAVATLLLIENSSSMSTVWRSLHDRYLPSVLRKLQGTTSNLSGSSLSPSIIAFPQFKVYQGGPCGLEFESDATGGLSAEKIHGAIDLLNTIAIQTQAIARHLVIVAASAPITHLSKCKPQPSLDDNVQCHLILKTDQDASPFEILFQETPTEAIIRLTETIDFAQTACTVAQASAYSQRSHQRLPLELSNGKSHDSHSTNSSQAQSEMSSLVAQLQKKHGLTPKKVYGIKPPRQPFVSKTCISATASNLPVRI
ncbi:hypothetical protein M378DRAFT_18009 [Amanita muscaria Koide BX008]|uniref:Mediator of RNA polymerase II transcription subunit 25 n=1 Tax=Amanita muscaria (strain Koide BX008) TaxID=946122 RepID=A0A0C2RYE8_AMAMK|nr:hypothetical protein M378DRAFT_18009 [Amanita muscaria Koide BX008]